MSRQNIIDLTADEDESRPFGAFTSQRALTTNQNRPPASLTPRIDLTSDEPERITTYGVSPAPRSINGSFKLSNSATSPRGDFFAFSSSLSKFEPHGMPTSSRKRSPTKRPRNFMSESSLPKNTDNKDSITLDPSYRATLTTNGKQTQPPRPSWAGPLLKLNPPKKPPLEMDLQPPAKKLTNVKVTEKPASTRPSLTSRHGVGLPSSASSAQREPSLGFFSPSSESPRSNLSSRAEGRNQALKGRVPPQSAPRWSNGTRHISGSESDTDDAERTLRMSIRAVAGMADESDNEERQVTETEEIQDAASAQLLESVSSDTSAIGNGPPKFSLIENPFHSAQQNGGVVPESKLLETHASHDPRFALSRLLAPDPDSVQGFAIPRIHLHTNLRPVSDPIIDDVDGLNKEKSQMLKAISPALLELKELKVIFRKHEKEMWAGQEYLMKPWLHQAKLDAIQAPQPELDQNLPDPFADVEGSAFSGPSKPHPRPLTQNRVQLQSTLENGAHKIVGVFSCDASDYESDAPTLPIYKSIVRLGPNILARNDKTLKYLPYFPEEEGPKGQKEGLYEELQKRYVDRVSNLSEQRRCAEMAEFWREYINYFLDEIEIGFSDIIYFLLHEEDDTLQPSVELSSQALAAWMSREEECPKCRIQFEMKSLAKKWSRLRKILPVPNGRALALAGLVCHIFLEATNFSIWHIASTAPPIEKLFRQLDQEERSKRKELSNSLCLICHLHDCPTHGTYLEHGIDSSSSSDDISDSDGELGHNFRQRVALPIAPKSPGIGQIEGNRIYGTDTSCKKFLGCHPDLNIDGISITEKSESSASGLEDAEHCGEWCYWDVAKRPDITVQDILSNPHHLKGFNSLSGVQAELYQMMLPAYVSSKRAPCMIASMIPDACCMDIFLKMLHDCNKAVPSVTVSQIPPVPVTKRVHSFDYWRDDSNTHDHDKRVPFIPCSHAGPCDKSSDCSCYKNRVSCEWICGCAQNCARRYQGCKCAAKGSKVCFQDQRCDCWLLNRECDPWLCGTCGVLEVLDPVNRYNEDTLKDRCKNARLQCDVPKRTLKGQSEVQGWGLFAGEDMRKHDFIGEYKGEIVGSSESDRRGAVYHHRGLEYLFKLNKDQEIDSSRAGNKMRFINNSCRKDIINVYPQKMLCNGIQRIGLFAKRGILAGEELFFNYGYPKLVTKNFWERGEVPGQGRAEDDASSEEDEEAERGGTRKKEKPKAVKGRQGFVAKKRQKKGIGRRISSLKQLRKNGKFSKMVVEEEGEEYGDSRRILDSFLKGQDETQGAETWTGTGKRKRDDEEGEKFEWTVPQVEGGSGIEEEDMETRPAFEMQPVVSESSVVHTGEIPESEEEVEEEVEEEGEGEEEEYEAENVSDEDVMSEDEVDVEEEEGEVTSIGEEVEHSESDSGAGIMRRRRIFGGDTRYGGESQKLGWVTRKKNMERMKAESQGHAFGRAASKRQRGVRTAKGSYRGVGGRPRKRGR